MLAMGSSKPWPDVMETVTGQRELDASAMLEYFKPLEEWLRQTNEELGVPIGWERSDSKKAPAMRSPRRF
jgi:Angiotensin-converting enzyme